MSQSRSSGPASPFLTRFVLQSLLLVVFSLLLPSAARAVLFPKIDSHRSLRPGMIAWSHAPDRVILSNQLTEYDVFGQAYLLFVPPTSGVQELRFRIPSDNLLDETFELSEEFVDTDARDEWFALTVNCAELSGHDPIVVATAIWLDLGSSSTSRFIARVEGEDGTERGMEVVGCAEEIIPLHRPTSWCEYGEAGGLLLPDYPCLIGVLQTVPDVILANWNVRWVEPRTYELGVMLWDSTHLFGREAGRHSYEGVIACEFVLWSDPRLIASLEFEPGPLLEGWTIGESVPDAERPWRRRFQLSTADPDAGLRYRDVLGKLCIRASEQPGIGIVRLTSGRIWTADGEITWPGFSGTEPSEVAITCGARPVLRQDLARQRTAEEVIAIREDFYANGPRSWAEVAAHDIDHSGAVDEVDMRMALGSWIGFHRLPSSWLFGWNDPADLDPERTLELSVEPNSLGRLTLMLPAGTGRIDDAETTSGLVHVQAVEGRLLIGYADAEDRARTIRVAFENPIDAGLFVLIGHQAFDALGNEVTSVIDASVVTDVPALDRSADFWLEASPNPFNPLTILRFRAVDGQPYTIEAFDARGRLVDVVARGVGTHEELAVRWTPRDLSSGVYYLRLSAARERVHSRVVLLR